MWTAGVVDGHPLVSGGVRERVGGYVWGLGGVRGLALYMCPLGVEQALLEELGSLRFSSPASHPQPTSIPATADGLSWPFHRSFFFFLGRGAKDGLAKTQLQTSSTSMHSLGGRSRRKRCERQGARVVGEVQGDGRQHRP